MSSRVSTINQSMASDYGTSTGQKEQLSGYFDVNNEGVSLPKGKLSGGCGVWTKKKKIAVAVVTILILLIVVIIIAAAVSKNSNSQERGLIGSLKDGTGCSGDAKNQNKCNKGKCIEVEFVCDGYDDCPDGEDEIKSLCLEFEKKAPCVGDQFQCLNTRECIHSNQRCNGEYNCGGDETGDYSDERNCFKINPSTSEISVVKDGTLYPMDPELDNRVGQLICEELGYGALQYIPKSIRRSEPVLRCGRVAADFNPDQDVTSVDDELVNKISIVSDCTLGTLILTCDPEYCGVFGNFSGPVIPPAWVTQAMALELQASTTPFPWVADIYNDGKPSCKGTIINSEWVLTASNCTSKEIFYESDGKSGDWKVVAAGMTDFTQERNVSKVMRNHFEKLQNRSSTDNIVAIQVDPPFSLNGYAHQICLAQPAYLPHFNCFAAVTADSGGTDHVRVILRDNITSCGGHNDRSDTFCFEYPHANEPQTCVSAVGAPVSCLDPTTNRWTLSGVVTTKLGCGQDQRLAASMNDEFNFNWVDVITAEPGQVFGQECPRGTQFKEMRFMRGSRQGEVYVDILGWGSHQHWHTVSNFTTSTDFIIEQLGVEQYSPTVRITSDSGIVSKRVAKLECPDYANTLCRCKVHYMSYSNVIKDLPSLHFISDVNQDGNLGKDDYEFRNWDNEDNLDDLYEDDLDYENPEKISADEVLRPCPGNGKALQCNDTSRCIPIEFLCDMENHCDDKSDENREKCEKYFGSTCPPGWFRCKTTYDCIPYDLRCDGNEDCLDYSDERECVRVLRENVVYIEQRGVSLPLSGLPKQMNDEMQNNFGISLCAAMGFGKLTNFAESKKRRSDFLAGCYELNTHQYGVSNELHEDFTRLDHSKCKSIYKLTCEATRCGTKTGNQGPITPESWQADADPGTNTTDKDYPWIVYIKDGDEILCEGTMVLSRWVVTAYDCITSLTGTLTAVLSDTSVSPPTAHLVTHKVVFNETRKLNTTSELVERNIIMLGVRPPFDLNSISHPLCLRPPLFVPGSLCKVSGHDENGDLMHVQIVPRDALVCEEANVPLSSAILDHQCVEYVHLQPQKPFCLKTKGAALQCLDRLRNQWTLPAIMTQDIGAGCERPNGTRAAATIMSPMIPWMSNIAYSERGVKTIHCRDGPTLKLVYNRANQEDYWYITTEQGVAVLWDGPQTLANITEQLQIFYGAVQVVNTGRSKYVSAVITITISGCSGRDVCDCTDRSTPHEQKVMEFFLLGPDEDKEEKAAKEYREANGVIVDNGNIMTTPFDILNPSEGEDAVN